MISCLYLIVNVNTSFVSISSLEAVVAAGNQAFCFLLANIAKLMEARIVSETTISGTAVVLVRGTKAESGFDNN
jgi:hypothetical protein